MISELLRNTHTNTPARQTISAPSQSQTAAQLANTIMAYVMRYRRIAGPKTSCATSTCEACIAPHLPHVISAIQKNRAITFVLPAFPAKSPNPEKVLGTIPDMAEQLSLEFLNKLCDDIKTMYSPGARVILCSDGRVFNDALEIQDTHVTVYQNELSNLIDQAGLSNLSTYNLDDTHPNLSFNEMRQRLMEYHAEPIEMIKLAVRRGSKTPCNMSDEEIHRQYCGMTRFLVEDASHKEQTISRTALQKACRQRAYIVIQRSRAWSALVEAQFPEAVRLSIHPQTCGTPKLGIRLMEAEAWMTPWHGVAVDVGDRFVLLKRAQAEQLGARLIMRNNRPSHYTLTDTNSIRPFEGI